MDADAARRLIEELLEAYNATDLDRAALLYAEDCRYVNRAYGIEVKGRSFRRGLLPYSAECVEGKFSELRMYGVLRSSIARTLPLGRE